MGHSFNEHPGLLFSCFYIISDICVAIRAEKEWPQIFFGHEYNSHDTDTTKTHMKSVCFCLFVVFFYKSVMKSLSKGGSDDAFVAQDFNFYPEFT